MNYLAHLLLAGDDPGLIVGALLGDFVRPRQIPEYSDAIQAGRVPGSRAGLSALTWPDVAHALLRAVSPLMATCLSSVRPYPHFGHSRCLRTTRPARPLETDVATSGDTAR